MRSDAIAVLVQGAQESLNALGTPGEAFRLQHRAELLQRQLAVLVRVGRIECLCASSLHQLGGALAHREAGCGGGDSGHFGLGRGKELPTQAVDGVWRGLLERGEAGRVQSGS